MAKFSTGALDEDVGLDDQLRSDVRYDRPPGGGDALFDLVGDLTGKRILDLGCGLAQYRRRLEEKGAKWVGLELAGASCSVIGDGDHLPFRDGAFDGVLCAAVLERMPEPDRTIAEVGRVLADGGKFFGYVAFLEPFHGMSYFHMTHMGLEHLLVKNGFRPMHIFAPKNGTAYQIETLLFPRHVPILQPVIRIVLQGLFALMLAANRLVRGAARLLSGRGDAGNRRKYGRLLALRFGVGFNFVAERVAQSEEVRSGYRTIVEDR